MVIANFDLNRVCDGLKHDSFGMVNIEPSQIHTVTNSAGIVHVFYNQEGFKMWAMPFLPVFLKTPPEQGIEPLEPGERDIPYTELSDEDAFDPCHEF